VSIGIEHEVVEVTDVNNSDTCEEQSDLDGTVTHQHNIAGGGKIGQRLTCGSFDHAVAARAQPHRAPRVLSHNNLGAWEFVGDSPHQAHESIDVEEVV
jgi:hypothetical protein